MKVELKSPEKFRQVIKAISSLVEEGTFEVDETGINFTAMDTSQISMVKITIPKGMFSLFEAEKESLCTDIKKLEAILARGGKGEITEIETKEGKLNIRFRGEKKNRTFSLPLIEPMGGERKVPQVESGVELVFKSGDFSSVLSDTKLADTFVTITLQEDNKVIASGGEGIEINLTEELEMPEGSIIRKTEGEIKAMFSVEYIENMIKASGPEIKLHLGTDKPLRITYKIGEAEIEYFLAPRIV